MSDLSYTIEVKGVQDLDKLGNVIDKLTGTLNAGAGSGKSLEELRKILVGLKGKGSALEELATAAKGFTDATAEMRKGIGDNFKGLERLLKNEFKQLAAVMQSGGVAAGAAAGVGVAQGMKDSAAVVEKETTALSKSAKANLKALQQDLAGYHNMLRLQVGSQNMRGKQATRMSVDDTRALLGMPDRDSMVQLAAQIKSQMQDALKTEGQRAKSATKMSVDDTRALLGMPDRDSMVQLAAQIKSQMQDALKTEGQRAKSATKMSVDDTRALLGMPDRDSMVQLAAQIKSQMQDALKTEGLRGKSATRMSVDDTRALLGMPDRDSMVQLAAQIKSQMQESMAKEKLRAASASKMTEEDTRSLFGLPSRAEMKTFAAQLKAQMASAIQQTPMKISRMDLGDMKYAEAMGSMRQFYQEEEKAGNATKGFFARLREGSGAMDDAGKKGSALGRVFRAMTVDGNDAHSMARGLASGFNLLWLTWGNLAPLFTGAAISYGVKSVVTMGAEVQNTMETIRVLSQETTASVAALNDQMLELARSGPFGPQAIADAMKTLSLAGLDAASVGSAIKDVLNFAVAGTTDLKTAADVMTSVATAFGIAATGYNYVGDIIAKTAAVSKSSVESIGEAFKTASVINKQYGISLEDVGVGLAALSNLGIQGSAAGTALRNMYADLSERTPKVAKAMESVGMKLRDQNGQFKDIISMVMEFDRVMSDLSTGLEKKALLRDVLSERGAKPLIELRDLATRVAKEVGTTTMTELEKLKARIVDSAGFMANAAAEMAMTPLNQMKSVTASLQATLVEAFNGLAPVILQVTARLKEAFASEEFKTGLATLMQLVSSLTIAIVENIGTLTKLAAAFALFKGTQIVLGIFNSITMAVAGMTAAFTGLTIKAVAASTLFTRLIGLFNPITAVLTVAYTAWQLYSIYTDKANKSTEQAATSGYHDQLIAKLEEETKRLNENTEAMRLNISVDELRAQREGRKLADAAQDSRRGAINSARANIGKAQSDYDKLAATPFAQTGAGARELVILAKRVETARDDLWKLVQNNMAQDARMDSAKQSLKNAAQENADEVRRQAAIKAAIEAARVGPNTYKPIDPYGGDKTALKAVSAVRQNLMKETEEANRNELAAIKTHYDSKQRLLKSQADNQLISQGEFVMREIALTKEAEDKQLQALIVGAEKYKKAYETQAEALSDSFSEWVEKNPAATAEQYRKQLADTQTAMANIGRDYNTTIAKMAQDGKAIKDNAFERLTMSANKAKGELIALERQFEEFWKKEENRAAQQGRATAVEDQLRYASPEQAAYIQATATEFERLQPEIEKTERQLDLLNKSWEFFIELEASSGALGAEQQIEFDALREKIRVYREELDKLREAQGKGTGKAGEDALTKFGKEEAKRLQDGVADSIMTGLLEGGKAGRKKLRDLVVNELKKPIKLVVDVVANMAMRGLGMLIPGGAAAGGSSAGGSSALDGFGSLGTALQAYGGFTAGASAASLGAANLVGAAGGDALGALIAGNGGWAGVGTAAGSLMSTIATVAPYLAALGAVVSLVKSFKTPGEQHTGGFYSSSGKTGMDAALAVTGGEAAARDLVKRATPEMEKLAKTAVEGVIKSSTEQAKLLGMNIAVGIDAGFAANTNGEAKNKNAFGYFDVTINGETVSEYVNRELGEDLTKAVSTWTSDMQDAVSEWMLGGKDAAAELAKDGETATQTVARLSSSLVLVNEAFATMGKDLLTASVASGAFASSIVDAFGGQDSFAGAHQAYFQTYYTEAERAAAITRNLSSQFAGMNLTLPTTNAEYRALVEAQDLNTEAGRDNYAMLLKLAPAFNQVTEAGAAAAEKAAEAASLILGLNGEVADLSLTDLQREIKAVNDKAAEYTAQLVTLGQASAANIAAVESWKQAMLDNIAAAKKAEAGTLLGGLNREVIDLGLTELEKEFNSVNERAAEYTAQLVALGQASTENIAAVEAWRAAMVANITAGKQAQAQTLVSGLKLEVSNLGLSDIQLQLNAVTAKAAEYVIQLVSLGQATTENIAVVDAWKNAMLENINSNYQQQQTEDATAMLRKLGKEVASLGLSDLQKELANVNDQADEYKAQLVELGQATVANVAAVDAWREAMLANILETKRLQAEALLGGLDSEVATLGLSPLNAELASIKQKSQEYVAQLTELGQATDSNIASVEAWEQAMTDNAIRNAVDSFVGGMADTIQEGLLGRISGSEAGGKVADIITNGIYNALAQGAAQQITNILTQGIISPIIQAALTGQSVTGLVSSASISAVVEQAKVALAAIGQVLNDPAIQQMMGEIGTSVAALFSGYNAPTLPSYTPIVKDSNEAADAARDAAQDAFDALQKAVEAQRELAQEQLDSLTRVRDIARQASNELYGFKGDSGMSLVQAQAFIANAAQNAQLTGYMPDADMLEEAVEVLKEQLTTNKYATKLDYDLAKLSAAAQLDAIADVADPQITALESQLESLDEILKTAQLQLDALNGINSSVLSVADALAAFNAALQMPGNIGSGGGGGGGGGGVYKPATPAQMFKNMTTTDSLGNVHAATATGSGNSWNYRSQSGANTSTLTGGVWTPSSYAAKNPDIRAFFDANQEAIEYYKQPTNFSDYLAWHFATYGIAEGRKFATGGVHTGGWAMVGEQGPELVHMPAGRVYNNGQTQDILAGDSAAAAEIAALRQEIDEMRAEVRATAVNTGKTQRLLDRITRNGESMQVTVVA